MAKLNLRKELDDWINEDKITKKSINTQILKILKQELKLNKKLLKQFKKDFAGFLGTN